jgi:ribosomal protein S18 acetylase RimI-like enzyme
MELQVRQGEESSRTRGMFRALFEFTEQAAQQAGAVGLRLYVDRENQRAQQIYQRLGMEMSNYRVMQKIW